MKKFCLPIFSLIGFFSLATQAFAQTPSSSTFLAPPVGSVDSNIQAQNVPQLIVNYLFLLGIFLAVVYLLFGGIKYITSRGNPQQVGAAKKHIFAAIIGIIVVAGTFFIIQTIFTLLGAKNPLSQGFVLPTLLNVGPSANP